jgi:hypothetical protein
MARSSFIRKKNNHTRKVHRKNRQQKGGVTTPVVYVPASVGELNDYHILLYMIYLFNNLQLKDKLNLDGESSTSFDNIVEAIGTSIISEPAINNMLSSFVVQIKALSSRPNIQQKLKEAIDNVKTKIKPGLHTAMKTELNTFLNNLL